jgi:hypothetical protein
MNEEYVVLVDINRLNTAKSNEETLTVFISGIILKDVRQLLVVLFWTFSNSQRKYGGDPCLFVCSLCDTRCIYHASYAELNATDYVGQIKRQDEGFKSTGSQAFEDISKGILVCSISRGSLN